MRVGGELKMAETLLEEAKRLWESETDPERVLDPGRVLDLEASLRRAQRRFEEALSLLDQAATVSHNPGRIMINKGFTLEVMGEYQKAVEVLLHASSLIVEENEGRLRDLLRLNLANNFCHLGRFHEALGLVKAVRPQVAESGYSIDLNRIIWLEGRIAAGLARPAEALSLLAEARRRFSKEGMSYDVALSLLEEAILLLAQGRTIEVKFLTKELVGVFGSKGVHREALAALQLFQDAASGERATVELTRNVLSYLFRARHDQGLRFRPE
jgi:tetratricopeptide (TPR) repeat protein